MDNRVSNLTWNRSEAKKKSPKGKPIYQLNQNRRIIRKWDKIKDAAPDKYSRACISAAVKTNDLYEGFYWISCAEYDSETIYKDLEWRKIEIEGYIPLEVSNTGLFRRLDGSIHEGSEDSCGYLHITLTSAKEKKSKNMKAHKLVAKAFLGESNGLDVNHIDANKKNNNINNLEYVTKQRNMEHAVENKLQNPIRGGLRKVDQLDLDYNFIKTYLGASEASRETGVNRGSISAICNRNVKTDKAGGYRWRFTPC